MDGYIRVSRRLGREGPGYISPDVQREAIERWAAYKDVEVDEWHVDEDWSGGTHERPGLERAIERATASETGGIVSWKIDRFSRYTEGGLRDLRRLEEAGARLAFVVEDIDTSGPMGKFVYTVMLAMGEYFLDTIKAGWRVAKTRARAWREDRPHAAWLSAPARRDAGAGAQRGAGRGRGVRAGRHRLVGFGARVSRRTRARSPGRQTQGPTAQLDHGHRAPAARKPHLSRGDPLG